MKLDPEKKSKLIFYIVIAIIAILVVAIVYQFVVIKQLQNQIDNIEGTAKIVCKLSGSVLTKF
jgi:hypothetical protein